MCRRAAALESELVNLEVKFASLRVEGGEPVLYEIDLHSRLTNTLRRVCDCLGWQRHMRDITPDPLTYAANFDRLHADDVEEAEV